MLRVVHRKVGWNFIFAFILVTASACGKRIYVVESRIPQQEVVADGKADDWKGALSFVNEEALFVGFQNSRSDLFVCLEIASGRETGQMLRQGMTVWFDPTAEGKKTLGIRYPLGAPRGGWEGRMMGNQQEEGQDKRPGAPGNELEILRPEKGPPERMTLDEAKKVGLEVSVDFSAGSFVYELKIPLAPSADKLISLGVQPDAVIRVGFETEKWVREQMPKGPAEDVGGGMAGRPRGMGGRPGGMGRGGVPGTMPDIPKPIKIWARVRLASGEPDGRPEILEILP
jgi:hypothetical protein